jgi:signal transduction histidine kinase
MGIFQLRSLKFTISPGNLMLIAAASFGGWIVVFHPPPLLFVIPFLIHAVAGAVATAVDPRIFTRFHPDCRAFFPLTDEAAIAAMDEEGRSRLIESVISFPRRRAMHLFKASLVQGLPAFVSSVILWKRPETSWATQIVLMSLLSLTSITYWAGAVYFESHAYLGRELKRLHERFDLAAPLARVRLATQSKTLLGDEIYGAELVVMAAILAVTMGLQGTIVLYAAELSMASFQVVAVFLGAAVLMGNIWLAARRIYSEGMASHLEYLDALLPGNMNVPMAPHSVSLFAGISRGVNSLVMRVRSYDEEMHTWASEEVERGRVQTLGEMAGLVVHDIAGPASALNYLLAQLMEKLGSTVPADLKEQLTAASQRIVSIASSLSDFVRGTPRETEASSPAEVWRVVQPLIEMQLLRLRKDFVRFAVGEKMLELRVGVRRGDLIHVLQNIASNAVRVLVSSPPPAPDRPEVALDARSSADGRMVTITVRDNGPGLSKERYEAMTRGPTPERGSGLDAEGRPRAALGLRLTRRLVERLGGSMEVVSTAAGSRGTTFEITLPAGSAERAPTRS